MLLSVGDSTNRRNEMILGGDNNRQMRYLRTNTKVCHIFLREKTYQTDEQHKLLSSRNFLKMKQSNSSMDSGHVFWPSTSRIGSKLSAFFPINRQL